LSFREDGIALDSSKRIPWAGGCISASSRRF